MDYLINPFGVEKTEEICYNEQNRWKGDKNFLLMVSDN